MLRALPLFAGLLPVVAIHASYLVAIRAALVPACIPYIEGCTSISSTGRYPPASYLFKGAMLPESILLIVYWLMAAAWLRALQAAAGQPARSSTFISVSGCGGAIALVLYVTFLGTQEPFYEFMRRFGVYLYFALTIVAQLVFATRTASLAGTDATLRRIARLQLLFAATPFALGLLNLVLKSVLDDARRPENVIEWIVALMMQICIALSYFAWRHTGFSASFSVRRPG